MRFILAVLSLLLCLASRAEAGDRFSFDAIKSVPEMEELIQDKLPLGTQREEVERIFVLQGHATLKHHPTQKDVEKYLYDINLCDYYIFRWNISADFSEGGKLEQAYVNGRFVYMKGKEPRTLEVFLASSRGRSKLMDVPRKMVPKGRRPIRYTVYDIDGNFSTTEDQLVDGPGPSRAEPPSVSFLSEYQAVDPWRSIFDPEAANEPVKFSPCKGLPMRNEQLEKLLGKDIEKLREDVEKLKTPQAKP